VLPYDYYGAYGHQAHQDHAYNRLLGAEYTFDFPPHHEVIRQECLACRGAAAVFDMSYFGKFYLVGADARKAADWLFSADVSRPPGSTVYTCMLNARGGTESDLTVSRLAPGPEASPLAPTFEGDAFYLAVGGAVAQHNWSHITSVLQDQRFRCQLIDSSEDLGMISIQGPASRAILQEVLDADLSNEAFPFSTHKLVRAAGHLVGTRCPQVAGSSHLLEGIPGAGTWEPQCPWTAPFWGCPVAVTSSLKPDSRPASWEVSITIFTTITIITTIATATTITTTTIAAAITIITATITTTT
ncbi:sarcosine dehydrogenase, mitochondrial-like, partial [Myotis lucifugus]|uniref:sarcosine dehydrogenase, mitochondrial-like n=1 Tax=Myotis lucifugus TaxID=59463 RepID=UPI000CCC02EC